MKFIHIFSICFLLFINVQTSDADIECFEMFVKGPTRKVKQVLAAMREGKVIDVPEVEKKEKTSKNCSNVCAGYMCFEGDAASVTHGFGCAEDFYAACSTYKNAVDEVRSNGTNDLNYHTDDFNVFYSSGCESAINGTTECIEKKFYEYFEKIGADAFQKAADQLVELLGKNPIQPMKNSFAWDLIQRNNQINRRKSHPNASNSQNGSAMKFIGIIIFGWILSAAWIY